MTEAPEEKAKAYLVSIEKVLGEMEFIKIPSDIDEDRVRNIVDQAHSYTEDAKYYLRERPSTALAAISYAEGLLDAVRFLGLVRFTWPAPRGDRN